jgi:hypothetical protein
MHTIRLHHYQPLLLAQDVRLLDMFDGALPPDPPETPTPAAHDFLVMCLRPDEPPARQTITRLRSAA